MKSMVNYENFYNMSGSELEAIFKEVSEDSLFYQINEDDIKMIDNVNISCCFGDVAVAM